MQRLTRRNHQVAYYNAVFVIFLAVIIIFTWHFEIAAIFSLFPHRLLSNPVTALCFLLSAVSFSLQASKKQKSMQLGLIIALAVMLTGMIRFTEIVFDYSTGIDRWLYVSKLLQYGSNGKPNYMAPNTALGFCFLGSSLSLHSYRNRIKKYISDFLTIGVLLLSFLSLVGYMYKSIELYHVDSYIPMAFPTAISFLMLSLSLLLFNSNYGVLRLFTRKYEGSKMARVLLPFAILIPIITGLLRFYGEQVGLYSLNFGVTLFAVANVFAFVVLIWWYSIYLNKSGIALRKQILKRKQLEGQLLQLNRELEKKVVERTDQLMIAEEQRTALETKMMRDKINFQRKLIKANIAGQEKEKKAIGMELHDHVNQVLASTKLCLDLGRSNPELKDEMILKAEEQILYAINEIRNISKTLVPHGIENAGLVENVDDMIDTIQRSSGIRFTSELDRKALSGLTTERQTAVYRIIQEQVNNILKHASASHVQIQVRQDDDLFQLMIRDDGKGFNTETKRSRIGLSNIKSRVELLNGEIEIISSAGEGCCMKIDFAASQAVEE